MKAVFPFSLQTLVSPVQTVSCRPTLSLRPKPYLKGYASFLSFFLQINENILIHMYIKGAGTAIPFPCEMPDLLDTPFKMHLLWYGLHFIFINFLWWLEVSIKKNVCYDLILNIFYLIPGYCCFSEWLKHLKAWTFEHHISQTISEKLMEIPVTNMS